LKNLFNRIVLFLSISFLLDYLFYYNISDIFLSSSYSYRYSNIGATNVETYIFSKLLLFIYLFISEISLQQNKFSRNVIDLLIVINLLPVFTFFGLGVHSIEFTIVNLIFWLFLFLFSFLFLNKVTNNLKSRRPLSFFIIAFLIGLLGTLVVGFNSTTNIDLNILNAYDLRVQAMKQNQFFGFTYILGLTRIILPVLFLYSLIYKKYIVSIIIFTLIAINYSFDGGKTIFFLTILGLMLNIIHKYVAKYLFLIGALLFLIMAYIDSFYSNFVNLMVVRRLFFVPQLINESVYNATNILSSNYFSQLLRFIGDNTNTIDINYYIGQYYFGQSAMSANSGMTADAFWQLNYLGLFVYPLFYVILLRVYDKYLVEEKEAIILIIAFIVAYYLNNSGLLAALFSHGLLTFIFILRLLRK
jgi:hypothetical protein